MIGEAEEEARASSLARPGPVLPEGRGRRSQVSRMGPHKSPRWALGGRHTPATWDWPGGQRRASQDPGSGSSPKTPGSSLCIALTIVGPLSPVLWDSVFPPVKWGGAESPSPVALGPFQLPQWPVRWFAGSLESGAEIIAPLPSQRCTLGTRTPEHRWQAWL